MNNYLRMWDWVKNLSDDDRKQMIEKLTPAQGIAFCAETWFASDVDVLEALKHWDTEVVEAHLVRGEN